MELITGSAHEALIDEEGIVCGGSTAREHIDCIDAEEYFGSVFRSGLTLLQLATLDRWASNVVRPLLSSNPLAGALLFGFVLCVSYGLLSVTVGVLVWSTVELAHSHGDHDSKRAAAEDRDTVENLCHFFEANLRMEERTTIDLIELRDALEIPSVATCFRALEMPFPDVDTLFEHLDLHKKGELTLDQFKEGLYRLKEPASRLDYARLAAFLGGKVTYMGRVEQRSEVLRKRVKSTAEKLSIAVAKLGVYAQSEDVESWLPEVKLRKAGVISMAPPIPPI